ncbi:DNA ligase D [Desulfopila inferna]|uniref:DNA ligase D n=1 Tax=Desulfopila inferna TaxID=468528 RepID=UPI0019626EA4|nr:DNA ligase D [Desulfopila inferna]MBM9603706.1 DNA ligase D [Desulfopila inferna]
MEKLHDYTQKRNFAETPEPHGTALEPLEKNRYVIQKHMARRQHFDLRLQVGDVLVSWAVPKQPVSDPAIKRLAIKVEDHPLDYIHFEGTIPKGNYGAGTVMVWDLGYYYINDGREFPTIEAMQHKLQKGALKLYLQGAKLRGFFNLVEQKSSKNNEWFFMKAGSAAGENDFDRSALTGRSMEEIAGSDMQWDNKKARPQKNRAGSEHSASAAKTDFPGYIQPMLATLTKVPFSKKNWFYELKLDGYRMIGSKKGDEVRLLSRNRNQYTHIYPVIADELFSLNADFIIDGEVCYIDSRQRANFQKLQNYDHEQDHLHYYVFDILWLNGHDLQMVPLRERKKILRLLLADPPAHIHYLDHVEENGEAFFAEIQDKQLEGIIAKRADGSYASGSRSKDWLKIKTGFRQEMIICGFIPSEKESRAFSSLVCGVYDGGSLVYTGRVGTGFSERVQQDISVELHALETERIGIENAPSTGKTRWVQPRLIAEIEFAGWTNEGIMRHASFLGLRTDKKPEEIQFEQAFEPVQSTSKVKLTNLSKIFWPEEGYTKEDVIAYYRDMAQVILPYLKDRPQSLYRTPNGILEKGFFQKNVREIVPDWADTIELTSSKGKKVEYLLCQDVDTLLYMANLGCIEINPWSSSLPQLDNPDFMIFDLDPVEVEMSKVVVLALEFKKLFDQLGLPAYCKTSGSRGLHLYVPVRQEYSYAQVQDFVKLIETHIHRQNKELTSLARSPAARRGRIYLDYLQNARGKTMASVYSIRPRPGAPVSAPIDWEELNGNFDPGRFTLRTMRRRLDSKGDVWDSLFNHRVDLQKILAKLEE